MSTFFIKKNINMYLIFKIDYMKIILDIIKNTLLNKPLIFI